MSLKDQLAVDLKTAMKSGEKLRTSVIRLLRADIVKQEIAKNRDLTDDELISVLITAAKQRKESIEQFEKGGRSDLAQKESDELKLIESYLPKPLSLEEIKTIISAAICDVGEINSAQKMGAVMKIVMPLVKGKADGRLVNQLVKDLMQG